MTPLLSNPFLVMETYSKCQSTTANSDQLVVRVFCHVFQVPTRRASDNNPNTTVPATIQSRTTTTKRSLYFALLRIDAEHSTALPGTVVVVVVDITFIESIGSTWYSTSPLLYILYII